MSPVILSTLGECFVYKMQMLILLADLLKVRTYIVLSFYWSSLVFAYLSLEDLNVLNIYHLCFWSFSCAKTGKFLCLFLNAAEIELLCLINSQRVNLELFLKNVCGTVSHSLIVDLSAIPLFVHRIESHYGCRPQSTSSLLGK